MLASWPLRSENLPWKALPNPYGHFNTIQSRTMSIFSSSLEFWKWVRHQSEGHSVGRVLLPHSKLHEFTYKRKTSSRAAKIILKFVAVPHCFCLIRLYSSRTVCKVLIGMPSERGMSFGYEHRACSYCASFIFTLIPEVMLWSELWWIWCPFLEVSRLDGGSKAWSSESRYI